MTRGISLNRFTLIPPFQTQITVFDVDIRNPWLVPPYNGLNPFPHPPVGDDAGLKSIPVLPGSGASAFDLTFATPYNQQWDLSIQHELAKDFLVTVAYVGLKGTKLYESINMNPSLYIPGQSSTSNTQQRRLYPWIGRIEQERTDAYSQYHSLQLSFEKRYSRGISILSNYTFSKITGLNVGSENEGGNGPRNPFNSGLDRGRLNYDVRHNWVSSFVWELPLGKYRNSVAKQLLQGWNWTGIFSVRSGFPFTVVSGRDNSLTSIGRDTADIVGNPALAGGRSRGAQLAQWFNTPAFTVNAIGTFGSAGFNILDGPGFYNFDTGILKNFPIRESKRLQFRFEAFNILNHANLNNPDANVSSPNFGRISGTSGPRIIELGLKFQF